MKTELRRLDKVIELLEEDIAYKDESIITQNQLETKRQTEQAIEILKHWPEMMEEMLIELSILLGELISNMFVDETSECEFKQYKLLRNGRII